MLIPFKELFARHGNIRPLGVLHLGANTGQEAEVYAELKIPRVIWVEAEPNLFRKLQEHIADFPGQKALRACVGETDGETVDFHIANNGGQSSSILELGTHAQEHPEVRYIGRLRMQTVRVDTLLSRMNIVLNPTGWLMNLDLQGAELMALKGVGRFMDSFKWIYTEVNDQHLYKGCPLVNQLDEYLEERGFTGVETKMTGNHWGDKFYAR